MAGPSYVIDGYNLLHKSPELAELAGRDLETARERLVGRLAGWRGGRNVTVTVVFDGTGGTFQAPRSAAGVRVVFSRPPGNADSYISNLVARHASPRGLVVVTSDNAVRRSVRDFGATVVSSEEFSRTLSGSAEGARGNRAEKRDLSAGEVAEWEKYFREGKRAEQNLWTPPRRKRTQRSRGR